LIVLSTIPVIAAGYYLNKHYPDAFRSITVIGWTTLGFGILLFIADKFGMTLRRVEHLRIGDALLIGIAQVLALIPGTSRSGITMSAARLIGMERPDAARFSMLMSIPAIVGAGTLLGIDVIKSGDSVFQTWVITATALAFFAALIAIYAMMGWLRRQNYTPFVIYRILLGVVILLFAGQM